MFNSATLCTVVRSNAFYSNTIFIGWIQKFWNFSFQASARFRFSATSKNKFSLLLFIISRFLTDDSRCSKKRSDGFIFLFIFSTQHVLKQYFYYNTVLNFLAFSLFSIKSSRGSDTVWDTLDWNTCPFDWKRRCGIDVKDCDFLFLICYLLCVKL